jgi:hypothetical protein
MTAKPKGFTMLATLACKRTCVVPRDFRKEIRERLEKLGRNRAWLVQQLGGKPSRNAVYTYLDDDGGTDMKGDHIARILDVLDREEKRHGK